MCCVLQCGLSTPGLSPGQDHYCMLCSWASLTVPLFVEVCNWIPAKLMMGG